MMVVLLAISLFLAMVLVNAFFAGYETGFVSADRIRIRYLSEEEKQPRAGRLLKHIENPDRMLTTLLVGTNIGLIIGTMALASQIQREWLVTLIATPIFLVFAEVIPKSIFRRHPNRLSLALLPAIRFFDVLLAPLVVPTTLCLKALRWMTGSLKQRLSPVMSTEEDLRSLVDESAAHGSIEPEEQEMIHSVMDLQTQPAKEIMVPRIDIDAMPETASRDELIARFRSTGRTRIPIFKKTIDTVLGVANVYDVLLDEDSDNPQIARFTRKVIHVPDTMPVDDLLEKLKSTEQHMAIVTDEYGGTDGLITLEDILEEIFGEIHDEHDREKAMFVRIGPDAFIVDARMSLEDLAQETGLPIQDDEAETVGGWVMHLAQRIPGQGETFSRSGFRFTILEGERNQVVKVRLDLLPETTPETEESE